MNYEENGVKSFAYENNVITLDDWFVENPNFRKSPTPEEYEAQKIFARRLRELLSCNIDSPFATLDRLVSIGGTVYNNPNFLDGDFIHTSPIAEFGKDSLYSDTHPYFYVITKSGTRYYCHVHSKGARQLILETKI